MLLAHDLCRKGGAGFRRFSNLPCPVPRTLLDSGRDKADSLFKGTGAGWNTNSSEPSASRLCPLFPQTGSGGSRSPQTQRNPEIGALEPRLPELRSKVRFDEFCTVSVHETLNLNSPVGKSAGKPPGGARISGPPGMGDPRSRLSAVQQETSAPFSAGGEGKEDGAR